MKLEQQTILPNRWMLAAFRSALIDSGWCSECLGELDKGYECNKCGYDAVDEWDDWQALMSFYTEEYE